MNITQSDLNIKCEISGCTHQANYSIELKKSFFHAKTHICEDCMKEIYNFMAKKVTPKSIKNPLKLPKKIEE